jgi:hypothetical protein
MENFNFNKLWISTVELVKVTGLSRSRIFQWKKEWEEGGNDVKDMGIITFKGPKKRTGLLLWDPRVFVSWLIKHKTARPLKYNYEFKERELIKNILVVNNLPLSKQQLWKESNNG